MNIKEVRKLAKETELVFEQDNWKLELRTRNNHPGYKIWGIYGGYEIFSFDERGLRPRTLNGIAIPENIVEETLKTWKKHIKLPPRNANIPARPYVF